MHKILIQVIVTIIIGIPSLLTSFAIVWPSYTIPLLESDASPLGYNISKHDGDLLGSFSMLGSLLATLGVGYISDVIGRKKTFILCGLFLILGWAVIVTAKSTTQIIAGRLITGYGCGLHIVVGLVFISEISQPSITGSLTTIFVFIYSSGTLLSYVEGWMCSYEFVCYSNLILSAAFVALVCWLKETPTYLLGKGMEKEALSSLQFYRGVTSSTKEVLDEFSYIRSQRNLVNKSVPNLEKSDIDAENQKLKDDDKNVDNNLDIGPWKLLWTSKTSRRTVLILTLNLNMTILMGMIGVQAYAGKLFTVAAPSLSPHLCSVILAVVLVVTGGLAMLVIDLVDRRVLMLISCALATCCILVLGSLLRWSWAPEWALPLVIVLYCSSFQMGIAIVPFIQIAESLTPQLKSLGTSIIYSVMFIANFIVLLLFGPAVNLLGLDGTFFLFAAIGALTTTMLYFQMRETRNVPFEVIQDMYDQGYLYRKNMKR